MTNFLNLILVDQPATGKGASYNFIIMIVLIMAVFYLFMMRPQAKKAKEQKKFREALKKGDRIVTIGGIHGKILETRDTTLIIEVEGGSRLKIERTAVAMGGVVEEQLAETK